MITPSYLGETIEYSSLHACRSTLEDPTTLKQDGFNELQEFIDYFDKFWTSKLKKLETILNNKSSIK